MCTCRPFRPIKPLTIYPPHPLRSRTKRTSITTGIVDRSESLRLDEAADRLSPLTGSISHTFLAFPGSDGDAETDLERFCDMDIDPTGNSTPAHSPSAAERPVDPGAAAAAAAMMDDDGCGGPSFASVAPSAADPPHFYHTTVASAAITAAAMAASANAARRHTVGPGHEQALGHPPINFKFGGGAADVGQMAAGQMMVGGVGGLSMETSGTVQMLLPTNLPMLQNQPLHNFGMKNHHLLKPPTVMENSMWNARGFSVLLREFLTRISSVRFVRPTRLRRWCQSADLLSVDGRHCGQRCGRLWRGVCRCSAEFGGDGAIGVAGAARAARIH